jgi:hypothetical protein
MANPYLIEAIYGPKPIIISSGNSHGPREASIPASRPLSLIERLYGIQKSVEERVVSRGASSMELRSHIAHIDTEQLHWK